METLLNLLHRASMGCLCAKERLVIEGSSYDVIDHLAEG